MTPDDDIAALKAALRGRARAARLAIAADTREAAAVAIAARVLALPEIAGARAVLSYGATPEEADPSVLETALRARGVRIAYPRVAGPRALTLHWVDGDATLVTGSFGLKEPAPDTPRAEPGDIDAIIVPGVAFDPLGRRLGFGGGFYDALLAGWAGDAVTVAIAYDEQVVEACPADGHDRTVDVLVTPSRTVRCATTRS